MKKYIAIFLILLLIPIVLADSDKQENKATDKNNTQDKVKEQVREHQPGSQAITALQKSITKGNASNESIQARLTAIERIQTRIQEKNITKTELKERIRNRIENIRDLSLVAKENQKERLKKIADRLDESTNETITLKEKIQKRNSFVRILLGHEKKLTNRFREQVQTNEERIQELESIKSEVSEEIAGVLDEQINSLKEENQELHQFIEKEQKKFSLFGWLFNR